MSTFFLQLPAAKPAANTQRIRENLFGGSCATELDILPQTWTRQDALASKTREDRRNHSEIRRRTQIQRQKCPNRGKNADKAASPPVEKIVRQWDLAVDF